MKLDEYDVMDLAAYICGVDEDDYPLKDGHVIEFEEAVEEALCEKYGLFITEFAYLMSSLLPLIDVSESPITGAKYKGFMQDLGGGKRLALLKTEAD